MRKSRTILWVSGLFKPEQHDSREKRLVAARRVSYILLPLALVAGCSLIAEYGFYLTAEQERIARLSNVWVIYGFLIQLAIRFLLVPNRIEYLTSRWLEFAVAAIMGLHLLLPQQVAFLLRTVVFIDRPEDVTRIYLLITQGLLFLAFVPAALRASQKLLTVTVQPSMLILLAFIFLIVTGTLFLHLPRATVTGTISTVDALFTATSAVCVTGLIVVDTATYFTHFGQMIILILIQIGGLGIMTLTTFFAYALGGGARLKEYTTLQSILGEENLGEIRKTVLRIAIFTFLVEALGVIALQSFQNTGLPADSQNGIFFSVFHSVSAFCNAGFTLTTDNLVHPALRMNTNYLSVIMALVFVGGIGFPVVSNIWQLLTKKRSNQSLRRLTIHSKIVLLTTAFLLIIGTGMIVVFSGSAPGDNSTFSSKVFDSLFLSVSARTAGFNTFDISTLSSACLFFILFLMWVGASPGSTGGGIKTTTLTLSLLAIKSLVSGSKHVEVFRKRISDIAVTRAFSTIILSVFYLGLALLLLLLVESLPMDQLLFELVSALGTVGLSLGITSHLSVAGKIIIIITMLVGRVGLLSTVLALQRKKSSMNYDYTEENILIT